jgi:hypothetical protein
MILNETNLHVHYKNNVQKYEESKNKRAKARKEGTK